MLATAVGGIVGQAVLKSLEGARCSLIGVDASECAAGLYASTKGYLVPPSCDPSYVDRLLDICAAEQVRFLFPGLDMELPLLAGSAARFLDAGVHVIISSPRVVALGDDKLETARFLESIGAPAPLTCELSRGIPPGAAFPLVLKPKRGGSRSRGVHIVRTAQELRRHAETLDPTNYVVQEHIAGEEYTCGTITFDGVCYGAVVMRRVLRDGDTHKAFVVHEPVIEAHIRAVAVALKPFGPCNFQLRLREGRPYIFDINPRCSGTTYLKALAGFNEPLMTMDYLERGTKPDCTIRTLSFFRYWNEVAVESSQVGQCRRIGKTQGLGHRL